MVVAASVTVVAILKDRIASVTAGSKALHRWCQPGTHTNTLQELTLVLCATLAVCKRLLGSERNASSWQGPGEPGTCRGFLY